MKNNFSNFSFAFFTGMTMILISSLLGCSGGDTINGLVPCEGTVKLNGKPLKNASIIFAPKTNGRSAGGMTNENGYYNLHTNTYVGVLPGEYKVTVIKSVPETEKDEQLIQEMKDATEKNNGVIPDSYNDVVVNFKSLTGKYGNAPTSDLNVIISDKGSKQQNFDLVVE